MMSIVAEKDKRVEWGLKGIRAAEDGDLTSWLAPLWNNLGWSYDELTGSPALMQKLVDGRWDEHEFLVIEPGRKIREDLTNEGIIKAE